MATATERQNKSRRVLVLNKNWQAVRVVSMERAMKYLTSTYRCGTPKARIVDHESFQLMTWADWAEQRPVEGEDCLTSPTTSFRVPTIVRLEKHDKVKIRKVAFSRKTLYRRDNNTCQYCGHKFQTQELSIDHVIPRCQGGKSTFDNCVIACTGCNGKKAGRTPEQAGMKLIRQPVKPVTAVFEADIVCKTWSQFLSAAYWHVELVD